MFNKFSLCVVIATLVSGSTAGSALAKSTKLKSSIQVSFKRGKESAEETDTPRLIKLAKVTKVQATKIGLAKYRGVVKAVNLENEDGNLIWSVEIDKHEMEIDAGNGKILSCT